MSVLAICGSPSSTSINRRLLHAALSVLPEGTAVDEVWVRELDLPMYSPDHEQEHGFPADALALRKRLEAASVVVLASPEHNGSMPAMLKNAIDWLSRTPREGRFFARPVALLSTSPGGRGGATNLGALSSVMPHWGAEVLGSFSLPSFRSAWDVEAGAVKDTEKAAELAALMARVAERA